MTKDALRVWLRLLAAESATVARVEKDLAQQRLPLPWYEVLVRLGQAPNQRLRMQDLARGVLLSDSGTTRVAEKMEAAGLLRREAAEGDQRGRVCVLTDPGRALLAEAQPVFFRSLDRHIGDKLSPEERKLLAGLLAKLGPEDDAED